MAPLIMREVEDDRCAGMAEETLEALSKYYHKHNIYNRQIDRNTLSRDNFRFRQKVFRNSSHYFSRA